MSKLYIEYEQGRGYDEKIDLEIRLKQQPSDEDYLIITGLITELDKLASKYLAPLTSLNSRGEE